MLRYEIMNKLQTIKLNLLEKFVRYLFDKNYGLNRRFLWNPVKVDDGGWNPASFVETGEPYKVDPSLNPNDLYIGSLEPRTDPNLARQENILREFLTTLQQEQGGAEQKVTAKRLKKNEYGTFGTWLREPFDKGHSHPPILSVARVVSKTTQEYANSPTCKEMQLDPLNGRTKFVINGITHTEFHPHAGS